MIAFLGSEKRHKRRLSRLSKRKNWGERTRRERGVVLVWFALMLVALLGIAGFAVDLSNWWLQAERLQKAADAGALAGVVYLPGDATTAGVLAKREVTRNGFKSSGGDANASVVVTQEPNPNRLRVRVSTEVNTYFVGLLGVDTVTLNRDAVAEFVAPVPMGSPENKLGNDPANGQNSPQFWINIAGPNSTKKSGDRYQAKNCATNVANCTGMSNVGIDSDDYAFNGYFFALKVTEVPDEPLLINVYDPAMTYVGDKCDQNKMNATQIAALAALPGNPYPDAVERFAPDLTPWCTGDQDIGGRMTNTTFIVREPDDTPWSDTDNLVSLDCPPVTMPAFKYTGTQIYQALHPTDGNKDEEGVIDGVAPWTFAELYRQNVTICKIPKAKVKTGDYILQVRSNVKADNPLVYDSTVNDGGHNRMSIQVGFGTDGANDLDGSKVSINARGRLPIYANAEAADTNFYLARVLPYDAGRTLRITLYDIGDVAIAGTLQIQPPPDSNATVFTGCGFSIDSGSLTKEPSTCTLKNVKGLDGRIVTVDVPIPTDYTCPQEDLTACWIKVRAAFPGGVNDTTTWSAAIVGNPVRLVE